MRYLCPAAAVAIFIFVSSSVMSGQNNAASGLSVANYQFVSEVPVTLTTWQETYRADLVNTGGALASVAATVTSLNTASFSTIPGEDTLEFSQVPANSQTTSQNTFTILVDRNVAFDFSNLQWTFNTTAANPIANAGPDQTTVVGATVALNGSASTNPSGLGTLTYSWMFASRPAGSAATLTNATSVMPSFVVDVPGNYVITLTVSNGTGSGTANVTISTMSSPPVANAGPNQTVTVGATVVLNGTGSSDVDGKPLTYKWTMVTRPAGSMSALSGSTTVSPTFVADVPGTYSVQLIVNDGTANSSPSLVTITTLNSPPVANAGPNQLVDVGALVQLNGAGSTDVNGNPLTYSWTLITLPAGSGAALSNPTAVNPTFTADLPGTYVAQLVVNDGLANSAPVTDTITTNMLLPPVANAGPNQTVIHGTTVTLSGSASDPQKLPLTLTWSLIAKPAGSIATLSGTTIANPTFVADLPGTYIAQLIANDGFLSSAPSTVTISTTDTPPVANAGPNQNVTVVATVTLDGTGSSDADHDPLTYSWSMLSRPSGSTATLSSTTAAQPTFVADVPGNYIVQLIVNDGFVNSNPSTVMITGVADPAITLAPNPLLLSTNAQGTLAVLLTAPAGPNGQIVHLTSGNTAIATVPTNVTVGAGTTGANAQVTPVAAGSTTITATASGFAFGTATVNVTKPVITVTLDFTTVGLTHTVNGSVVLNAPAPPTGVTVSLSSSPGGFVDVEPPSLTIISGNTTGSFTVTGLAVGSTTVTAGSPGYVTGSASVTVGDLGAILLPATATVNANQSIPLQISLATGAPVGGATVTLTSSDPSKATVPATIFIPQLATTPATQPQLTGVNFGSVTITASSPGFIGSKETVTVTAGLSFSPQSLTIAKGVTKNLTLNLSSPAPAGLTVNLSSDNPAIATVPATVSFLTGATSVTVAVTGVGSGATTIHASDLPNLADTTASVTVVALGSVIVPANTNAPLNIPVAFPVSLSAQAPTNVTVTLVSSDTTKVTVSPSTVTITAGQTTPAVQPQVTAVNFGSATITASAPGFANDSGSVLVTASLSFTPPTLTISGIATQNLTLTLSSPAPSGGITVNLSSSNTSAATLPAIVTILAGSTTVSVPVTSVAGGTATIHASSLPNLADTTATVTVTTLGSISLPANLSLTPGQSAPIAVSLSAPAGTGGVTVTLASSDTTKATVSPLTVFIAAGQTKPATQPQVTGVNFGTPNINASAPGYTPASLPVQVTATLSFSPTMATIIGTATQNLTLTLSVPAPSGGVVINLSSSNAGVASVPPTVAFAAGATSVTVVVTGVTPGPATIHASALPNIADTTASITVTQPQDITLPTGLTVGPGQSVNLPVTLTKMAPSGGVFVTLTSSNISIATLNTSTVFIPQGATTSVSIPRVTGVTFGSVTITATAFGLVGTSTTVQVTAALSYFPATISISGTSTKNVSLILSASAPASGLTVNLSSDNPSVASVPPTVNFAAGATSVSVPVTGVSGGSTTIHASALPNILDTTASVTVTAPGAISLPSNITVGPGQSAPFPVTLGTPAPSGGVTVTLVSTNTSNVTISPAAVTVAAGQTVPTVQPAVSGVALGSANINATAPGYTAGSQTVKVGATIVFAPPTANITGTATQNLMLNLSVPAPAGLTITLTSSNTNAATVPASVAFATSATSVTVPVTGAGAGSATITASTTAPNIANATAAITVIAATPASITINGGGTQSTAVGTAFATPLAVTVKDSGSLIIPNTPVTFTAVAGANGQSGSFSNNSNAITLNTNSSGVANAGTFTANTKVGSYTVTVTAGTAPAATFNLTNAAGAATQMTSNTGSTPQSAQVSTAFANPLGVTVKDASNNPVQGIVVTFTAPVQTAASGIFTNGTGTMQVTSDVNGWATTPFTANAHAGGPYNVTATATGLTGVNFALTNTVGPPNQMTTNAGTTPQSAKISTAFGTLMGVTVKDASSNPIQGVVVTFTAPAQTGASGTFANGTITTQATTDVNGVATATAFTANTHAGGPYNVSATASGLSAANFALTNTPGAPTQMTANTGSTPQSAKISTAFAMPLGVTVLDASNNPVQGIAVTFTAPAQSGASGTFANATGTTQATTDVNGMATATTFTANTHAGSPYNVTATATGLPAVNFALTDTAGTATQMTANAGATPQSASVSTAFGAPLGVTVEDASNNPVQGIVVTFTAPAQTGASGTFANATGTTQATTNANGVATATAFTANTHSGGPYNVTATATGLPAVNFALTDTAGAATQMTANTGTTPQSAKISTAFGTSVGVTVKDVDNNPVQGVVVTFTAPAQTGASGTFANGTGTTQATTDATGVAKATAFTANTIAGGPYNIAAAATGLTTVNFALTNTPGAATQMTANTGTAPQSAKISTAFGTSVGVTVKDVDNNPVQGVAVTFTAPAQTGPSGTFANGTGTTLATTDVNGLATATVFTANTHAGGPYNVTATATGLTTVNFALTNTAGAPTQMTANTGTTPQAGAVSAAFGTLLAVTIEDASNNPVPGITVTFTAPAQTGSSGTFANGTGTTQATTNASGVATATVFTANAHVGGPYNVAATATGLPTVNFALTNTAGPPASIVATSGTPQTTPPGSAFTAPLVVTVTDAGGNPEVGLKVTFTAPAQTGASGTFQGGLNTATTNSAGVATSQVFTANATGGSYTVTASVAGLTATASFSLSNAVPSLGLLGVSSASLGQNLQTTITVSLPQAAAGTVNVALTSSDATKLLFNNGTIADPTNATSTLTIPITAGTTSVSVIIQSPGGSTGTASVTASAAGYTNGSGTITITPSGFVLAGPNGNGNSFTVNQGTVTALTVSAARLDSSFNFVETQQIRLGATISVPVTSSATNVGTIVLSPITFTAGNDTEVAQFTASSTTSGSTTLTAGVPTGFSAPLIAGAPANSVFVTVNPVGIVAGNATVGQSLETSTSVTLNGVAPPAGLPITLTSNSPNLKLSTTPTGAGQSSIIVTVPPAGNGAVFYVYGGAKSGTATYSATSSLGNATGTVTFGASAIVIAGPSQVPGSSGFLTTTGAGATTIFLFSVQVDGSGNIVSQQAVAGGAGVSITVTSNDIAPAVGVGSISPPTVTLPGGSNSVTTSFIPASAGSANIAVDVPAGFSAPAASLQSVQATVVVAGIACTTGVPIGHDLEVQASCSLGQFPPAGGINIKLTGSSGLQLAVNPTDTGSSSITVDVPSGTTSFSFYLYAVGAVGTAPVYTATATGYSQGSGTVNIAASAPVILGPFAFSQFAGFPVPVDAGGTSGFTVAMGQLDSSGNLVSQQALAGGLSVVVDLTDSNAAAGTIAPVSPITITGGSSGVSVVFTAGANALSTTIAVSGATANAPYGSVTFNVN
jgi:hypothetical protein